MHEIDYTVRIKISRLLFVLCWVVYCVTYLGRINYSAALASIIQQGLFTKSQAGLIGTVFFFCYGGGQLVNGFLGDKISSYKMILIGLTASSLANFLLPFGTDYIMMALIWGVNGLAQSMMWPPILYIISNILVEEIRKKACLYIASSVPVGTFLAYFISMLVMRYFSWKAVFFTASAFIFAVACIWLAVSMRVKNILGCASVTIKKDENKCFNSKTGNWKKLMISSGAAMLAASIFLHGMLKDGVNNWVPTMITETYGVSPSFSVFLSMFLPIINLSGAYIATFIYKKYFKQNEIKVAACFVGLSVIPLIILLFIGKIHVQTSIAMLALFTTLMLAFNHLTITLVPVHFAKYNRASTVSGFFNSITYAGCAISNYGFGFLSDAIGWQKTIGFWSLLAVLAVLFCALSFNKWGNFIQSDSPKKLPDALN